MTMSVTGNIAISATVDHVSRARRAVHCCTSAVKSPRLSSRTVRSPLAGRALRLTVNHNRTVRQNLIPQVWVEIALIHLGSSGSLTWCCDIVLSVGQSPENTVVATPNVSLAHYNSFWSRAENRNSPRSGTSQARLTRAKRQPLWLQKLIYVYQ